MPAIRLDRCWPFRISTSVWPRHRPLISETVIGPVRVVRLLSDAESARVAERQRAHAFADQQRRRA